MTNESSIKYLSSLLESPGTITDGDQSSIKVFRQTFPYFVPIRYLEAVENNKAAAFSPQMLSSLHPYLGNWILFCDFLESGNREQVRVYEEQSASTGSGDFFQLIRGELPETSPVIESQPDTQDFLKIIAEPEVMSIPEPEVLPIPEPVAEQQYEPPVQQIENDEEVENEIVEEPVNIQAEPEPVVAVSEAFLQLIREEGLGKTESNVTERVVENIHIAPVAIVPQPVFELQKEQADAASEIYVTPVVHIEETKIIAGKESDIIEAEEVVNDNEEQDPLIFPIYTQDYFLQQGEKIPDELPAEINDLIENTDADDEDKSLMVVMSFSEWLLHFKNTARKQEEEKKDQKALKTMWQKEKLAAAIEEENEEIPENVFEMAVNSITKEDGLASESLADIYIKQGKYDKAIEMYRKLSLRNPQKNAYFARKIEEVLKDKQS